MDEPLKIASLATSALDQFGVRWFLGGSLASSLLGTPRATLDAGIVADLRGRLDLVVPLKRVYACV